MANQNISEKYHRKYSTKSCEKIRETLQTTLFNPRVQSALPLFAEILYCMLLHCHCFFSKKKTIKHLFT